MNCLLTRREYNAGACLLFFIPILNKWKVFYDNVKMRVATTINHKK